MPGDYNRHASDIKCSQKLALKGAYQNYLGEDNPHPYCKWLVESQSEYASQLDRQELLVTQSDPNIGDERLEWIRDYLIKRL